MAQSFTSHGRNRSLWFIAVAMAVSCGGSAKDGGTGGSSGAGGDGGAGGGAGGRRPSPGPGGTAGSGGSFCCPGTAGSPMTSGGAPSSGGAEAAGGAQSSGGSGVGGGVVYHRDAGNGCAYVTSPSSWADRCETGSGCVSLNPSAVDGGASISHPDSGSFGASVDAPLCDPPSPSRTYLFAFDAFSSDPYASFQLTTGRFACEGQTLENFSIGDFPSDVATGWRSYCFSVPGSRLESRVGVIADPPGYKQVTNLRAVASCDCVRDAQYLTTCGLHGNGGSSGCL